MSITKKIFVSAFLGAFAFAISSASAAYYHTTTLKQGSTGAQVLSLQQTLNLTSCKVATSGAGAPGNESTYFGAKTKAAVQCFQASNGLTADGVVGPMTGAALSSVTGSGSTGSGSSNLPAGCTSTAGYSPVNGQPCNSSTGSTGNGSLSGGAGDLDITKTSTDVEDNVKEGEDDVKVLGIKAEADGSDIAITSIKVELKNTGYNVGGGSSENLTKYVDEVSVFLGDNKVGSVDADEFSKESGSPDIFSKTIALSGAIVGEDDEEKLYVAFTGANTIDSDDQANAAWDIQVDTIRFNDATGAILSGDVSSLEYGDNDEIEFGDASEDDDLELKTSSANPDDETIKVDKDDSTDDVLALAVKLDNDEDSSDATIYDIPVKITVANYGSATNVEDIVEDVTLEIDGQEFEGDLSGAGTLSGTTTVTYNFDIDGDVTIDAGDVADIKVYVTLHDQEDNYAENTTVKASIDNDDIDAENEDGDEMDVSGAERQGALLTLNTTAASISNISWQKSQASNSSTGTIDFFFTLEAEDEDYTVVAAEILDTATAAFTDAGSFATDSGEGVLSRVSGDATANGSVSFTVAEGDTARFRVRYSAASAGTYEVTITNVAGKEISDDDQEIGRASCRERV